MQYLADGVGVMRLVKFWLSLAIARRLRELGREFVRLAPRRMPRSVVGLPPGTAAPEVRIAAADRVQFSVRDLHGVIGFLIPSWAPCCDQVPAFVGSAGSLPCDAGHALAVVSVGGRLEGRMVWDTANRVVVELVEAGVAQLLRGPTARAVMAVTGYPSFVLLGADGRVEVGAHGIAGLGGLPAVASSA